MSILDQVVTPDELRSLEKAQLPELCDELRAFLLTSIADSGGHFSAGLGVVELTVALHYVFNTPEDRLVWDVGHQAYPHKILTGRRDRLSSIRQQGGLSGFPTRSESEYDAFGVGHSSTSISAALGMAIAAKQQGIKRQSIAVIGDGALTAGMAYEALNHAGTLDVSMLVVLNDNDMSISPNVGGLRRYLSRRTQTHVKGASPSATLFEEMGFNCYGPVDGHDVLELVRLFEKVRDCEGLHFLHVLTKKGKGYVPAENDPCAYHGVSAFDLTQGLTKSSQTSTPTYTQVFSKWLCDIAARDERVVGITPAMCEGSGLVEFSKKFPDRYFDVAIAEQHAVTLAAGLACDGMKPVVAIYSTFLQRAYDQLIHDVAIQNLPVIFAIDRAGLVGADGMTHAGSYDLSYLRCIPNMVVMVPADENECRHMLYTAYLQDAPTAVRYPRDKGVGAEPEEVMTALDIGKAKPLRDGKRIAILLFGALLDPAKEAAEVLDAGLVNMRFVKPLDEAMIQDVANKYEIIVTLEDNAIQGGAGSAVSESLAKTGTTVFVLHLGLPDRYIGHASREQQLAEAGLSAAGIIRQVNDFVNAKTPLEFGHSWHR
ncbi:MAG: 1-deoxy-D-xylulose-5-phosphate synthase [Proteobacteria bacterium]|nr:MAG: 1-deoxy-D-xylulose-5-phosphate synthase [Pseudomonadota bacterium]